MQSINEPPSTVPSTVESLFGEDLLFAYPGDTSLMSIDVANDLLKWAVLQGASDISFAPNEAIFIRRNGEWHRVMGRRLTSHEISALLDGFSKQPSASAQVKSGKPKDFRYEITISRGKRASFRCSATGCRDGWSSGVAMVIRTIASFPPKIEELELPDYLIKAAKPKYGLVLVTGPVGSGKTTLLSSLMRDIAETERKHILTYEHPIEFDLMGLPNKKSLVVQSEVPIHLETFSEAPRNSLRRAGDVVLFGEARDQETLKNMAIEAETGVAVYSTVHTNSVAETMSRIIREFPSNERDSMAAALIGAMRVIIHQRLVISSDEKSRIAIREWLILDDDDRKNLMNLPSSQLINAIQHLVDSKGHSLKDDITEKFTAGLIAEHEYEAFMQIFSNNSQPSIVNDIKGAFHG